MYLFMDKDVCPLSDTSFSLKRGGGRTEAGRILFRTNDTIVGDG